MVRAFKRVQSSGSVLGLAVMIAVICFVLIASIASLLQFNQRQTNASVWRDRLQRLGNEGYIKSLARLSADPAVRNFDVSGSTEWGIYTSSAVPMPNVSGTLKNVPGFEQCIYVVTTAKLTYPTVPAPHTMIAHSFVSIADAGRYFGASKSKWIINRNFNCENADIYGSEIMVVSSGTQKPNLRKIDFYKDAYSIDTSKPAPYAPQSLTSGVPYDRFITADQRAYNKGTVNKLAREPIFPQISPQTLAYLKSIATSGSANSFFTGETEFPADIVPKGWASGDDIFPPGCVDAACGGMTNEQLKNHVYFVDGDLKIKGRVHGQIVFVATGTISVVGDLISHSLALPTTDFDSPAIPYPGCPSPCKEKKELNIGKEEASNAHQAILITPSVLGIKLENGPTLDKDIWPAPMNTFTLEAFIVAPHGAMRPVDPTLVHSPHDYNFVGAFILGAAADLQNKFVYTADAAQYMETLASRPPPYVPGFTQLLLWHEVYQ